MTSVKSPTTAPARTSREIEPAAAEAPATSSLLHKGSSGDEVDALHKALRSKGYETNETGQFGTRTDEAVRRFQRDNGLTVDGIVGPQTRAALEKAGERSEAQKGLSELPANTHFRWASSGEGVRRLQRVLNEQGANLNEDGKYGRDTTDAVRAYQQKNGLKADGIAGPNTIGSLIRVAPKAEEKPSAPNAGSERAERSARVRGVAPDPHAAVAAAKANEVVKTPSAQADAPAQAAPENAGKPAAANANAPKETEKPAEKSGEAQNILESVGKAGQDFARGVQQGLGGLGQNLSQMGAQVQKSLTGLIPGAPAAKETKTPAATPGETKTTGTQSTPANNPRIPVVSDVMDTVGRAGQELGTGLQKGFQQLGQNLGQVGGQIQQGLEGLGTQVNQLIQPQLDRQAAARSRELAATQTVIKDQPAGAVIDNPLGVEQLRAPKGSAKDSAPMAIFDNPETIHSTGLIGSTIADRQAGRGGDTGYEFSGEGRLYSLVNNRTHDKGLGGLVQGLTGGLKNVENSVIAYNPSDKPLTLELEGVMYSKSITKTDGKIHHEYQKNGDFRGPHAITASSYMAKNVGENGYMKKTVTIPPKSAAVVANVPQAPGGEAFTLLDFKADGKFRLAQAVTDQPLSQDDLKKVVDGSFPTAGSATRANSKKGDFIAAGPNELGRPNGVSPGSVFRGGGEVKLEPGRVHGEMFLSTRFKQAEEKAPDLMSLEAVAGNKGDVGQAARSNDGSFGMTYDLRYALNNPGAKPRRVQVVLTSPGLATDGPFNPGGGMLTLPVRMDGVQHNLRVSQRHTGVVIGTVEVPPGSTKDLSLEFTNFGNLFPPAGIELRTLPEDAPNVAR